MPRRTSVNIQEKIARAVLAVAAKKGWGRTTLADVAAQAHLSLADLRKSAADRGALLEIVAAWIDKQAAQAAASDVDPAESGHDRLFTALMAWFDTLQDHRAGGGAILKDIMQDPCAAVSVWPLAMQSVRAVCKCAHIAVNGPDGVLKLYVLSVGYIYMLRIWLNDTSPDLSAVMAALDTRLTQAESLAAACGL